MVKPRGRLIATMVAVGFLSGITFALLRPATYSTSFSFLPQGSQDASKAGLASLAGQFGLSLGSIGGSSTPPQLYADLLMTREILLPIADDSFSMTGRSSDRVPLSVLLDQDGAERPVVLDHTMNRLRRDIVSTAVATRTTGMVTVNVRTKSPQLSFQLAQRLLDGLNHFNLVTRQSQARQERVFAESRYEAARTSLRQAEDVLQQFLQDNRQFSNSPQLTLTKDRLQREVSLRQQVVTSLAQQYEDSRIREVRDTPVITVIERPAVAAVTDPRMRVVIVVLATFGAFCVSLLVVFVQARRDFRVVVDTKGLSRGATR